jgi:hypothetical protein
MFNDWCQSFPSVDCSAPSAFANFKATMKHVNDVNSDPSITWW